MPINIALPDIDTTVYFRNEIDEVVAQADLIQLDTIITTARTGLDILKPAVRYQWVQKVAAELSLLLQRSITPGIAATVIKSVHEQMCELKKTIASIQTLPSFTGLIPEVSPQSNDAFFTTTSLDSQQSVNSVPERPYPFSQQNEPIHSH